MLVGNEPGSGSDNGSEYNKVDDNGVEGKVEYVVEETVTAKGDGVCDSGDGEEGELQSYEGGIISGPVVLGLFSIVGHLVYFLCLR